MSWLPLSFGAPMVLWGLLALPVIWWLLRFTPPKPQTEVFPPLKILARVLKREETPQQSPWWLTLLRLLMAALIVTALAEPVFNPRERLPAEGAALALVID
ncbi:MAG: RNA-binding protein, partial [Mesorhizobium sp.]